MSTQPIFTIRKTLLVPVGLLTLLVAALLVIVISQGQPIAKALILALMLLPLLLFFAESAVRRVEIGPEAVTVHKLMRRRSFAYAELTAVEVVVVRQRAFLSLSAGDDFLILTNGYADFAGLVRALFEKAPEGSVDEESRRQADSLPVKRSDIVSAWLLTVLLVYIIYVQLAGHP